MLDGPFVQSFGLQCADHEGLGFPKVSQRRKSLVFTEIPWAFGTPLPLQGVQGRGEACQPQPQHFPLSVESCSAEVGL